MLYPAWRTQTNLQSYVDQIIADTGQNWAPDVTDRELLLCVHSMGYSEETTSLVIAFKGSPPSFLCFIPINSNDPWLINGSLIKSSVKHKKIMRSVISMIEAAGYSSEIIRKATEI